MFACVNADYAKWLVKKHDNGEIEILDLLWKNKSSVGKRIVTKQLGAGNHKIMEIIDEYKYPEGSEENKKAWAHAQRFVGHGKTESS